MARFSVRVSNRSAFATADLAALFRACLKAHHVPAQPYRLEVVPGPNARTKKGKALAAAGRAPLGYLARVGAPLVGAKPTRFVHGRGSVEMAAVAADHARAANMSPGHPQGFARWCWTLDHEVKHVVGWTDPELDASHDPQIIAALGSLWHDPTLPTVPGLPLWAARASFEVLSPRPAKAAPSPEALQAKAEARRERKILRAQEMLAKAEAKLSRAERAVTRWKRKLAGLQRAQLRVAAEKGSQP